MHVLLISSISTLHDTSIFPVAPNSWPALTPLVTTLRGDHAMSELRLKEDQETKKRVYVA